jgi:hypothetical protein
MHMMLQRRTGFAKAAIMARTGRGRSKSRNYSLSAISELDDLDVITVRVDQRAEQAIHALLDRA